MKNLITLGTHENMIFQLSTNRQKKSFRLYIRYGSDLLTKSVYLIEASGPNHFKELEHYTLTDWRNLMRNDYGGYIQRLK